MHWIFLSGAYSSIKFRIRDFMLNDHLKVSITYTSLFILNFEK